MNIPKLHDICEGSRLYYYDFLFQKDKSQIPESVLNHLKLCKNCQKQIYSLKKSLTQVTFTEQQANEMYGTPLSNMLKLHFSYVDYEITCKTVKPFLPGLLDPSMHISIPTPITTHIDHCRDCVNDLKKISDLNLNDIYLLRLSRLFASKPDDDITCSQAKSHIMAFVMLAFQESDEQTLKHLCSCRVCRSSIHQYRESIREELLRKKDNKQCFLSGELSNNDIFDLTIPYGLDIAQYRKSDFPQSRASHIRHCPFCLEKIQELHRTIYDIAGRTDSGVITKYNVEESSSFANANNSGGLYSDFPINVEVSGTSKKTKAASNGSIINFTAAVKNRILTSKARTISKVGIAGLLIIAAFTAMFFYSQNVKALSLEQLYSTLEKRNNIHISSFMPGQSEPVQEKWLSRTFDNQIVKTGDELILWDITGQLAVIKKTGSDTITTALPEELLDEAEKSLNSFFGITSFYSISDVPPDAVWEKIANESDNYALVYELSWKSITFTDEPIFNKLRFTFKNNSELPERIDFYRKQIDESEYSLDSFKIIDYPGDEEIASLKKQAFFSN